MNPVNTPPETQVGMRVDWNALMTSLYTKRSAIDKVIGGLEELFADGTLQVLPVAQPVSQITAPVAKQSVQFERKLKLRKSSNRKSAAAPASNACEKHPSSGITKKGVCKGCTKAAYMKDYLKERKVSGNRRKKKPEPTEVGTPRMRKQADMNRPSVSLVEPPDEDDDDRDPVEMDDEPDGIEPSDEIGQLKEPPPTPAPVVRLAGEFVFSKPTRCPKCGADHVRLQRRVEADLKKDHWLHVRPGQQPCTLKISHYQPKDDVKYRVVGA